MSPSAPKPGSALRARIAHERCKEVGAALSERTGISPEVGSALAAAALGFAAKKAPVRLDVDGGEPVHIDAADATLLTAISLFEVSRGVLDKLAQRAAAKRKAKPKRLRHGNKGKGR